MDDLLWIRKNGTSAEHAGYMIEENLQQFKVKWTSNQQEEWLLKNEYTITKDSDQGGRRGRKAARTVVRGERPSRQQKKRPPAPRHRAMQSSAKKLRRVVEAVPNQAVCFNVGGTKYTVARSTIEQYPATMLARLISDTWSGQKEETKGKAKEIFIDRDGSRFRYVLDYLRDGRVHIPLSCTKGALLQDLHFFGFDSIAEDSINTMTGKSAAVDNMILCKERFADLAKTRANEIDDQILELKAKKGFSQFAYYCFNQYTQKSSSPSDTCVVRVSRNMPEYKLFAKVLCSADGFLGEDKQAMFNECLGDYGMKYVSHKGQTVTVTRVAEEA